MELLNNISGQQFYFSTVSEIEKLKTLNSNCAIVIDEDNLNKLLSEDWVDKKVNQIIIITENVYPAMEQIKAENILLIAVSGVEQAIGFTMYKPVISKNVVFITGDKSEVERIVKLNEKSN